MACIHNVLDDVPQRVHPLLQFVDYISMVVKHDITQALDRRTIVSRATDNEDVFALANWMKFICCSHTSAGKCYSTKILLEMCRRTDST